VNVRAMKQSALMWHAIPNELLVHVFTFLSCVDRIRVAQLVCSRWRHVVLYLNNAPHCCLIYAHNPSLVKKYAILCHTLSHTWIDGRNKSIRGHLVGERKCAIDRECVCVCVCVSVVVNVSGRETDKNRKREREREREKERKREREKKREKERNIERERER